MMYINNFCCIHPSSVKTTTLSRLITQYYKIIFQPHPSTTERANVSASQAAVEKNILESVSDPTPAKLRHAFHTLGIATLKLPRHQAILAKTIMETRNDWHNQSPKVITFVQSEIEAFHRQRESCEIHKRLFCESKSLFSDVIFNSYYVKPFAKLFFQAGTRLVQKTCFYLNHINSIRLPPIVQKFTWFNIYTFMIAINQNPST